MPKRWLQIKGDPSVRDFLFQQERVESLFDAEIDKLHDVVSQLFSCKGMFHSKIHYSSSQLTCWFASDPFCYEKFVREEVFEEFRRLRLTDETVYLRNGAINVINGMINMSFSCDGTHYIDHRTFFERLESFETSE